MIIWVRTTPGGGGVDQGRVIHSVPFHLLQRGERNQENGQWSLKRKRKSEKTNLTGLWEKNNLSNTQEGVRKGDNGSMYSTYA